MLIVWLHGCCLRLSDVMRAPRRVELNLVRFMVNRERSKKLRVEKSLGRSALNLNLFRMQRWLSRSYGLRVCGEPTSFHQRYFSDGVNAIRHWKQRLLRFHYDQYDDHKSFCMIILMFRETVLSTIRWEVQKLLLSLTALSGVAYCLIPRLQIVWRVGIRDTDWSRHTPLLSYRICGQAPL